MWPTSYWAVGWWNVNYWERGGSVVPVVVTPEPGVTGLIESAGERGGYLVPQEFWRGPRPIARPVPLEVAFAAYQGIMDEEEEEEKRRKKREDQLTRLLAEDEELLEII